MCRMVGYLGGASAPLSSVVLDGEHSLLVQSYAPQEMMSGVVNADGFGVGWDGTMMTFTRYSTEGAGNSLYFVEDAAAFPGAVIVASERLDGDTGWREVPDRHLLVVEEGGASLYPL